ncbi:MAG: hypothetical protein C5B52_07065 [Bacteroidetes bacterium]|nr:MAG: hypothetical protein C5B52_07065 [Bacteroidota bacterium]
MKIIPVILLLISCGTFKNLQKPAIYITMGREHFVMDSTSTLGNYLYGWGWSASHEPARMFLNYETKYFSMEANGKWFQSNQTNINSKWFFGWALVADHGRSYKRFFNAEMHGDERLENTGGKLVSK